MSRAVVEAVGGAATKQAASAAASTVAGKVADAIMGTGKDPDKVRIESRATTAELARIINTKGRSASKWTIRGNHITRVVSCFYDCFSEEMLPAIDPFQERPDVAQMGCTKWGRNNKYVNTITLPLLGANDIISNAADAAVYVTFRRMQREEEELQAGNKKRVIVKPRTLVIMIVPMVVDYLTGLSASSSDSRLRVVGFSALIQFCLMSKEIIESWYEKKFWFSDKEFEGFIGQLQRLASYFATTTNQYRERPRIDELTLSAQEPITALVYVLEEIALLLLKHKQSQMRFSSTITGQLRRHSNDQLSDYAERIHADHFQGNTASDLLLEAVQEVRCVFEEFQEFSDVYLKSEGNEHGTMLSSSSLPIAIDRLKSIRGHLITLKNVMHAEKNAAMLFSNLHPLELFDEVRFDKGEDKGIFGTDLAEYLRHISEIKLFAVHCYVKTVLIYMTTRPLHLFAREVSYKALESPDVKAFCEDIIKTVKEIPSLAYSMQVAALEVTVLPRVKSLAFLKGLMNLSHKQFLPDICTQIEAKVSAILRELETQPTYDPGYAKPAGLFETARDIMLANDRTKGTRGYTRLNQLLGSLKAQVAGNSVVSFSSATAGPITPRASRRELRRSDTEEAVMDLSYLIGNGETGFSSQSVVYMQIAVALVKANHFYSIHSLRERESLLVRKMTGRHTDKNIIEASEFLIGQVNKIFTETPSEDVDSIYAFFDEIFEFTQSHTFEETNNLHKFVDQELKRLAVYRDYLLEQEEQNRRGLRSRRSVEGEAMRRLTNRVRNTSQESDAMNPEEMDSRDSRHVSFFDGVSPTRSRSSHPLRRSRGISSKMQEDEFEEKPDHPPMRSSGRSPLRSVSLLNSQSQLCQRVRETILDNRYTAQDSVEF